MAQRMKAAVVRAFRAPLVIEEMAVPSPKDGQILVKYEATGVCHTDLHAASGDWPVKPSPPFVPGHEGVGFVAGVGAGVKRVKEGDRVGVPWLHSACGYCPYCRTGWETLCASQSNTGYSVNGTFAQFGLADPDFLASLPDSLDFGPAAPVLCAGVTVYKGLKETEVRPGEWVAISGVGGLGHMAVQYAKAMGMHVVAADIFEDWRWPRNLAPTSRSTARTRMRSSRSRRPRAGYMEHLSRRFRRLRWNKPSGSCVRRERWLSSAFLPERYRYQFSRPC